MNPFRFWTGLSVPWRILVYILTSIFLFWILAFLIVYVNTKRIILREASKKAQNLAEYIANGVSGSLILGEAIGVRAETALFKNDDDLAVVKVEGGKRNLVVVDVMQKKCIECHGEDVFREFRATEDKVFKVKNDHVIVARVPVAGIEPEKPVGTVYVFLSPVRMKGMMKRAIYRGSVYLLLIAIFLTGGGYLLTRFSVTEPLKRSVEVLNEVVKESAKIVGEVKTGTSEQAASVNELATNSEEIAGSATQIAEMASITETTSFESAQVAEESEKGLQEVMEEMERTREKIEGLANKILQLSDLSQKIGKVNAFIEDISEQTRLLAVNASIEATGAGEVGRRFGVVAGEIKNLSLRTREATKDVSSLIDEILSSITKAVMATEEGTKSFNVLKEKIERIRAIFKKVREKAEDTLRVVSDITSSTAQQKSSSEQMAQALGEVKDVANQIAEHTSQLSEHMEKVKSVVEELEKLI